MTSRVARIARTIHETLPRLPQLGLGSSDAYSVVATATDYLPEAVGGYLRLPREWADTRPIDGYKTSLMVLIDQLELLGSTMDKILDAANRADAAGADRPRHVSSRRSSGTPPRVAPSMPVPDRSRRRPARRRPRSTLDLE